MARQYDPYLNRFISPDTIIPDPANPQSLNRYSYGYNNPVKYLDPSGHIPWPFIVIFLVGVALEVNSSTPLPPGQVPPEQGFWATMMMLLPVATWYAPGTVATGSALACGNADCTNEVRAVGEVLCADGSCTNEAEQVIDPLQQVIQTATSSSGQRTIQATTRQLQHTFKHASDFGLSGNWSTPMKQRFLDTLQAHINGANTVAIEETYRGMQKVVHYFDPTTGRNVMLDLYGNLVAAWQLSEKQIEYLLSNGNVQ